MTLNVAWLAPEIWPEYPNGAYIKVEDDGSFSDLCVVVNESPENLSDGSAHFEVYSGAPEDYYFRQRKEGYVKTENDGEKVYVNTSDELVADNGELPTEETIEDTPEDNE